MQLKSFSLARVLRSMYLKVIKVANHCVFRVTATSTAGRENPPDAAAHCAIQKWKSSRGFELDRVGQSKY